LPWSNERLTLCFDDEATAEQWRLALNESVISCQLHSRTVDKNRRAALASESSDAAAVMAALPSDHSFGPSIDLSGAEISSSNASGNALQDGNASSSNNTTNNDENSKRSWQSIYHVNGVAVYAEDEGEGGEGGAVMASVVVRAPPRACFQVLMHTSPENSGSAGEIPFSDSVALLETIDAHTQVVRHSWLPERGLGRWIAAPRDFVGLRTWRKEPDGTYIVLYQSTTHRKARAAKKGWSPWSPVRAKIEAAGFTISPLLPQYVPGGGPSQECLVTLVIKADLAGSLSSAGLLSKLAPPVAEAARWRVMSPLLLSVVALRDRVEQRRFVVMPYTMSEGDDVIMPSGAAEENGRGGIGGVSGALGNGGSEPTSPRMKLYQRTTTFLTEDAYNLAAASASKRGDSLGAASLAPVMEDITSDGVRMTATTITADKPSTSAAVLSEFGEKGGGRRNIRLLEM
jgi:START domain